MLVFKKTLDRVKEEKKRLEDEVCYLRQVNDKYFSEIIELQNQVLKLYGSHVSDLQDIGELIDRGRADK